MALQAYRFFSNNCREAMTRYQEIFGGELYVMGFGRCHPARTRPRASIPTL